MKKIASVALSLLCFTLCGCTLLEEIGGVQTVMLSQTGSGHRHAYEQTVITAPTCTQGGEAWLTCFCGEEKAQYLDPLGHDYGEAMPTRFQPCQRENCNVGLLPPSTGTYATKMQCTYTEKDIRDTENAYSALLENIQGVGEYSSSLHGYVEGSSLYEQNKGMESLFNDYERRVSRLGEQYQYAQVNYHVRFGDEEAEETYLTLSAFYKQSLNGYYSLYQSIYDSAYRDYFYYGQTEESVQALLAKYGGNANGEIVTLETENSRLLAESYKLADVEKDAALLTLYRQFVQNNNRIASLQGYGDTGYMDYAYQKKYEREYTPQGSAAFFQNVKTYITPIFDFYNQKRLTLKELVATMPVADVEDYRALTGGSFFENTRVHKTAYEFLGGLTLPKENGGSFSYQAELASILKGGNYFLGNYKGAYEWYVNNQGISLLYFGEGYQKLFTVVHELGHYMNRRLNKNKGSNSFDLLETHSQGIEMLLLDYLEERTSANTYSLIETEKLLSSMIVVLYSTAVDAFERAVYTGVYEGLGRETLFLDGEITVDEYDELYAFILEDLGIAEEANPYYWRHVVMQSPAYYISYATSMTCSMGLYAQSKIDRGVAMEKYLYLVKENDNKNVTYKGLLEGAGLLAYDEEALFESLYTQLTE